MKVAEYERCKKVLENTTAKDISVQLKKAEQEYPELVAAYNLLAIPLYSEIQKASSDKAPLGGSVVNLVPQPVIESTFGLNIDEEFRQALCEKLNKWAARVSIAKFLDGVLEEPNHYECD